ncbi:MAG: hypothetical protein LPK85_15850 [Gammaproteobacteria bacterium]|nr:hypothetical protein [Gammaproteobacteria bacterium]
MNCAFLNARNAYALAPGEAMEALAAVQSALDDGDLLVSVRATWHQDETGEYFPKLHGEGVYVLPPDAYQDYRNRGGTWLYVRASRWLHQWQLGPLLPAAPSLRTH